MLSDRVDDDVIMKMFPIGSLCTINNASGLAAVSIYRVVEHFLPGERKLAAAAWVGDRKKIFKSHCNNRHQTRVQVEFRAEILKDKLHKPTLTVYDSHRLRRPDILLLSRLHVDIEKILKELI